MAPLAMRPRSRKASANPATLVAQNWSSSTTGSAAKPIACLRSWLTSSAVALQLSLRLAILLRLQPKLRPRRSRSPLASVETRSAMGWLPALPGQAATLLALTFLPRRSWPSGWDCYTSWCPRPAVLSCWQPDQRPEHRVNITRCTGSCPRDRTSNSDSQRQHQPRDRGGLRHYCTQSC